MLAKIVRFASQCKTRLGLGMVSLFAVVCISGGCFGAVAQAASNPNLPPTAQAVTLNTYGSLPVVVLNLTQSMINMTVSTSSSAYGNGIPLAIGYPGVYYGSPSPIFSNILNPGATPDGNSSASLTPFAQILPPASQLSPVKSATAGKTQSVTPIDSIAFNNNYGFVSIFTAFPSWTSPAAFNNTQYVSLDNFTNGGANPTSGPYGAYAGYYNVVAGSPSGNGANITKSGDSVTAYGLNAAQATTYSINLQLRSGGQQAAMFKININSLGAGNSGDVPVKGTSSDSILQIMHSGLDLFGDFEVFLEGDPVGIAEVLAGVPAMMNSSTAASHSNTNVDGNSTTYKASSAGINVSATATEFNDTNGEALNLWSGDSQALEYQVQAPDGTYANLPLIQQNAILLTTWRQMPIANYGVNLPNSADTLFVLVVNNGVYASNQVQQYINSNSGNQSSTAVRIYKPTKEMAQDTLKILGMLTSLAKDNPRDAAYLVEMFGTSGKIKAAANNPSEMSTVNNKLRAMFERYERVEPACEQLLKKLAQKR